MCYGQRTFMYSSQRHSATHHLLCEKLSDFFAVRFCSTRWCLYLGHPMRTVLFLVLDRPAISQLTYHSNSSQPGNAQRTNVYELSIRSLYTTLNTHERTVFSSSARDDVGRTVKCAQRNKFLFSFFCLRVLARKQQKKNCRILWWKLFPRNNFDDEFTAQCREHSTSSVYIQHISHFSFFCSNFPGNLNLQRHLRTNSPTYEWN